MPTPLPVNVLHGPPATPLEWGTFIAALVAALAALATLWQFTRKSRLHVEFPKIQCSVFSRDPQAACVFAVGCNVVNSGNRGLRDFRVAFAFEPSCGLQRTFESVFKAASTATANIEGKQWSTVEFHSRSDIRPRRLVDCYVCTQHRSRRPSGAVACLLRGRSDSQERRMV